MAEGNSLVSPTPFPVVDPERIPAPRYYDEAFYRLECERLWPHVWQMACRLEQVPEVGDWIEYSNLGKSVIVVRTKDGVKAFHNACRHRGVQLAKGHGSCETQGFTCPFHGWRWNIEGKNTFVYGKHMFSEHQLDQADLALAPCRVELWGGCAFINHDDDAPSFRESIGPLAERLEKYGLDQTRAEWCYATVLPANWKVAMEAFMEGYHVMRTHPQLHHANPALTNSRYGQDTGGLGRTLDPRATIRENIQAQFRGMELLSEGMAGMCHAKDVETARKLLDVDLPEDPMEAMKAWYGMVAHQVVQDGRARGESTPDLLALAVSDPVNAVEFLFPHYFLLPFLSSFSAYRIRPLGPESCLFEIWSLTQFPEGQEPPPVMDPVVLPYDSDEFPPIPRQDYSNIPDQQLGLHADGFEFMRLSKEIEGLIGNYHQIIDGYLKGAAPAKLAKATHLLGGNFDGPIHNLGL
ncbi:aromatic ring-hydroxylating dioxygenase subunit alpha [Phenylobacterium sp. LjRoot219]|uniref:aromatic ring-hydroxylating oxygenase subunit alpha n=1 Tax=Phenylobacterium sp. LjRoot219 TaxID=3342283 RepID=UPI003ECEE120